MNVDVAEAEAHQLVTLDEDQRLVMLGSRCEGQLRKQRQDFRATAKVSTRQLANDERMHHDFIAFERRRQASVVRS